jgi:hypothetical protein
LEVFRTINFLNDLEREVYHTKRQNSSLVTWKRSNFTKFYLFYDESTAIQNANWKKELLKENGTAQEEYIMQNRKLWTDVYIIWADWNQNDKSLRRHVEWWYKVKPLWFWLSSLPFFKNFWVIERHKKDENWNILMIPYIWKDEKGDYIKKEKPCQENVDFFYKPFVWDYYDDLHKNIRDKNKLEINTQHLKYFIWQNSQLINLVKDKFPDLIDFKNEEKA